MANEQRDGMKITTALILSSVLFFLVNNMVQVPSFFGITPPDADFSEPILTARGAYSWYTCFGEWQLWRLISYQFLHAGVWHLVFNMWALFFFGYAVEASMGARRFLFYYLACGVSGALFSSLLYGCGILDGPHFEVLAGSAADAAAWFHYLGLAPEQSWQLVPMVGASAAIYGVLVAAAFLYPHSTVRLVFPPVEMSVRTFALLIMGIAVYVVLVNGHNAGGEAGHLGGILFGALFMLLWRRRAFSE